METAYGRAILLYLSTTIMLTMMGYISDKMGERIYFVLSALALMSVVYLVIMTARTGRVGAASICLAIAYVLHLVTALLINKMEKEPIIPVIMVHTFLYIMIGLLMIISTLIVMVLKLRVGRY